MTFFERFRRLLRDAFVENATLKLTSFVVAIGCFTYFHGAQNAQRTFQVSVVVLLPNEQLHRALLTDPPAEVRVTLRGPRSSLDELRAEDLGTVQLDVRRGNEPYAAYDTSDLRIPTGVEPTVDPPGIELAWDDVIARPLPIQTTTVGFAAKGFAVQGDPTADPAQVVARGPKTIVETLQHAKTEPFDVSGLPAGTHVRRLAIDAPPKRVTFDVSTTQVTLTIGQARLERIFSKIPVQIVGGTRASSTPADVDVRVDGPPDVVAALRPEQIVPIADLRAAGIETKTPGSALVSIGATIEGCATRVVPSSVVVKW